jgi:hypothetical protein
VQGDNVTISAVVTNTNATEQTYTLNFTVGDTVTERTVTVAADSEMTVTHVVQFSESEELSEYDVYVNIYAGRIDVHAQTTVTEETGTTPTTEPQTELAPTATDSVTTAADGASGPGFTMVSALLAAILSLLLAHRVAN